VKVKDLGDQGAESHGTPRRIWSGIHHFLVLRAARIRKPSGGQSRPIPSAPDVFKRLDRIVNDARQFQCRRCVSWILAKIIKATLLGHYRQHRWIEIRAVGSGVCRIKIQPHYFQPKKLQYDPPNSRRSSSTVISAPRTD